MLNVGPLELLVVLAVALIVVGPERLPELARSVGRALRQLRQVQDEVRDMVSGGVDDEMRQAAAEFKKATGDVARAAGVGDVSRKTGRSVSSTRPTPRRRAGTATPAPSATPEPAVETGPVPAASEPVSSTSEPPPEADTVDAEVAGPPADRLVEDGTGPASEPPAAADAPDDAAADR
jgi:Tat protein translocase TatB subunit